MAVDQQQNLCRPCGVTLVLCLLSIWAIRSDSQNIWPSEHGLAHEKDPGEASPTMVAFFGRPKVALPEAGNVTDPAWRAAARVPPTEAVRNGGWDHTRAAVLIAGVVFGIMGVGLLGAAVVAYAVHARQSRLQTGSSSLVDLTRRRSDLEVRLGAA